MELYFKATSGGLQNIFAHFCAVYNSFNFRDVE